MNILRALIGRESRAKTPYQTLVIHWLTRVTDDPAVQGAGLVNIIGKGSHKDCRNRMPCIEGKASTL
jgi:hypothetical protein